MTQNRRYFGMTVQQIAILAGMAVLVCVLFTVAGCFFLQGAPTLLARAPQDTPVPQATATLVIIPTFTPTETPTPVPYEMLIPEGWTQFKTGLVEIWLPKEFKKQNAKQSDSLSGSMTQELEMMAPPAQSSVFPAIVMVAYEPLRGATLDDFLTVEEASLSTNEAHVVEMRKVNINSVEAIRLVIEMRIDSSDVNGLMYFFQDGDTAWVVYYMAQINDFYMRLDTFEKSARTFRIVR